MGTISQKLTYLNGTKQAIRSAIEANGVYVDDSDTFRSYADKIRNVNTLRIDTSWYYFCDVYNKNPVSKVSINPAKIDVEQFSMTSVSSSSDTITATMTNVPVGQYVIAVALIRGNEDVDVTYSDDWQLVHTTPMVTSWDVVSGQPRYQRMMIFIKQATAVNIGDLLTTESLTIDYSYGASFHSVAHIGMFYIYGLKSFEYNNTFDANIIDATELNDYELDLAYPLRPGDKATGSKLIWFAHCLPPADGNTPPYSWATTPNDLTNRFLNNRLGVFIDFGDGATSRTFYRSGSSTYNIADGMGLCALKFTM